MNCALRAKGIVNGLGKNYANLQAVVKICQLSQSCQLSSIQPIRSWYQELVSWNGGINGMSTGSPAHSLPTRPVSAHPVRPGLHSAIFNGSLFAGYACSFYLRRIMIVSLRLLGLLLLAPCAVNCCGFVRQSLKKTKLTLLGGTQSFPSSNILYFLGRVWRLWTMNWEIFRRLEEARIIFL